MILTKIVKHEKIDKGIARMKRVKTTTKIANKILQGSAVTQNCVRWVNYKQPFSNLPIVYVYHKLRKSVDIRQSYERRQSGPFLQGVSVAASPVLATIGMSVCPSVRPSVCLSVCLSHAGTE